MPFIPKPFLKAFCFMTPDSVQIGKISYINASPVYYGLDHGLQPTWLQMVPDVPAVLNRKIMTGEIQISPISAAFYAMNHRDLLLLPDLSISCNGRVLSVILASRYPLEDLEGKTVLFSKESASAASFLKMIFRKKKITPEYLVGEVTGIQAIPDQVDAVLVIGDTALVQPWHLGFRHCIDLGLFWHDMTGLPFVFAVWVVRKAFAREYPETVQAVHELLLASKDKGYRHLDQVIDAGARKLGLEQSIIKQYFDLLLCDLDEQKVRAMALFFDSLLDQGILSEKANIRFFRTRLCPKP